MKHSFQLRLNRNWGELDFASCIVLQMHWVALMTCSLISSLSAEHLKKESKLRCRKTCSRFGGLQRPETDGGQRARPKLVRPPVTIEMRPQRPLPNMSLIKQSMRVSNSFFQLFNGICMLLLGYKILSYKSLNFISGCPDCISVNVSYSHVTKL
ncbi:hypothetical protein KSP40_PGU010742 [Platanthera guangdongensis]|uniref:Uncharacterized protein n=1 Tax=Platanthera guangdongensis TaxID=2320717 RepID=A0ABR2LJ97_9ASPA